MSWHLGPLASFDVESTGLKLATDRIVTAALVRAGGETIQWVSDIDGLDVPTEASDIHGITTAYVRRHGLPAKRVTESIADAVARELTDARAALVVMNAPFDLPMLDAECARHGVPTVAERVGHVGPVVDPLVLDRKADKWRKGPRKLEALATHYGVTLDTAHDAVSDAQAALGVTLAIGKKYRWLQMPADVLHRRQAQWYADWAEDFEAYKRKTEPGFTQSRVWPLPLPEAVTAP